MDRKGNESDDHDVRLTLSRLVTTGGVLGRLKPQPAWRALLEDFEFCRGRGWRALEPGGASLLVTRDALSMQCKSSPHLPFKEAIDWQEQSAEGSDGAVTSRISFLFRPLTQNGWGGASLAVASSSGPEVW